jgi:hypothetical protein
MKPLNQVSFDFDSTLSRKDVQDYAKSLIDKGYEGWILTSRFEDCSRYNNPRISKGCNDDLYRVALRVGIPKERIIFANMEDKWKVIKERKDYNPIFHLDDDYIELNGINRNTPTAGIDVISSTYKKKCNKLLET